MTTPPEPAAAPPAPSTEAEQNKAIADLRAEQTAQRGILEQIRDRLTGTTPPAPAAGDPPPAAGDIGEQMRQAVRDVRAEEEQAKTANQPPPPEQPPREVARRSKDKLQRAIFGHDPEPRGRRS